MKDLHRHSIRLPTWDYSQIGWYFVTMCVKDHICLFGDIIQGYMQLNTFGKIVDEVWNMLPDRYQHISLGEYAVMPNHFHGIIIVKKINATVGAIHELPLQHEISTDDRIHKENDIHARREMLIPKAIGYFKMNSAKNINILRKRKNTSLWQRNYYEHIIRNEKDYFRIKKYIQDNPKQWSDDKENPKNL